MSKQNWPRHICDKIPDENVWANILIAKAPNQDKRDGMLYGQISWKIFKFKSPTGVFWIPTNDGEELNPPICPYCGAVLNEEEKL